MQYEFTIKCINGEVHKFQCRPQEVKQALLELNIYDRHDELILVYDDSKIFSPQQFIFQTKTTNNYVLTVQSLTQVLLENKQLKKIESELMNQLNTINNKLIQQEDYFKQVIKQLQEQIEKYKEIEREQDEKILNSQAIISNTNEDHQKIILDLQTSVRNKQEQIQKLEKIEEEFKNKKVELMNLQDKYNILENNFQKINNDNSQYCKEISELKNQILNLNEQAVNYIKYMVSQFSNEYIQTLQEYEKINDGRRMELEKEILELQKQLSEQNQKVWEINLEKSTLDFNLNRQIKKVDWLESQNQTNKNQIRRLETNIQPASSITSSAILFSQTQTQTNVNSEQFYQSSITPITQPTFQFQQIQQNQSQILGSSGQFNQQNNFQTSNNSQQY